MQKSKNLLILFSLKFYLPEIILSNSCMCGLAHTHTVRTLNPDAKSHSSGKFKGSVHLLKGSVLTKLMRKRQNPDIFLLPWGPQSQILLQCLSGSHFPVSTPSPGAFILLAFPVPVRSSLSEKPDPVWARPRHIQDTANLFLAALMKLWSIPFCPVVFCRC